MFFADIYSEKKFESRSIFDEVIKRSKMCQFLGHPVCGKLVHFRCTVSGNNISAYMAVNILYPEDVCVGANCCCLCLLVWWHIRSTSRSIISQTVVTRAKKSCR